MTLMEYLIKTGSERVAQQCRENIYAVQTLKDFQYIDRDGKDQVPWHMDVCLTGSRISIFWGTIGEGPTVIHIIKTMLNQQAGFSGERFATLWRAWCVRRPCQGVNVREKAKQLVTLLKDEERLREERIHALKTKEKMAQTTSGRNSVCFPSCSWLRKVTANTPAKEILWWGAVAYRGSSPQNNKIKFLYTAVLFIHLDLGELSSFGDIGSRNACLLSNIMALGGD